MDRFLVETKIAADESGELSGLAWPFGTPDRVGDVIEKGAFSNVSLPLPMLFGHDMTDPVGAWAEAVEKEDGLHVKGSLLVNDLPRAREVHALIKAGAVRGLSIGFSPKKAAPPQEPPAPLSIPPDQFSGITSTDDAKSGTPKRERPVAEMP